jgi:ABC-type dipeptide/oligopeptide/nickel transport system permease subunit
MQDPLIVEGRAAVGTTAAPPAEAEPELTTKQLTQLQLTWVRFRRHKPALAGVVILLFMIALAALAGVPQVMPESPYNLFSYDPINNQNLPPSLHPHWYFLLGTDDNGHTMVSQIMWGARISLAVGFIGSLLTSLVGVLVGSIAGYFGDWTDTIMMRVTDIFLTLPFLPMLILAADIFGQGHLFVIIGIFVFFTWPSVARLARASYLSLRTQEFAEAARAVGVSNMRIIFRHLLPNALRPLIVATTLNVASFIVVEAAIDFLGAGIRPPDASWGNILANAQTGFSNGNWWWGTFPGVFLVLTVLAVNFLGDGLGDALDVRSRV